MKIKNILWLFGIYLNLALLVSADEVWVTSAGTDNTGSGTAADPYVRSSQATFDALFSNSGTLTVSSSIIPTNSTIHLMAGTFLTQGDISVKTGWKIRGAGIDATVVRVVPLSSSPPGGYAYAFGGPAWYYHVDGVEVSDMTIDCNLQNQSIATVIGAVELQGGETKISRVKAINWGTTDAGAENFVFMITTGWDYAVTNCVIEECVLEQPAQVDIKQGADGFCIGGGSLFQSNNFVIGSTGWVYGAEIRGCRINNINVGDGSVGGIAKPVYFKGISVGNGVYSSKIDGNLFININGAAGCAFGNSCGSLVNCSIENNMFIDVGAGIVFQSSDWCPDNTNALKSNIQVNDNFITVQTGGYGINISGIFGQAITNLMIEDNVVQAAFGAGAINALAVQTIQGFSAQNNVLDANGGAAFTIQPDVAISHIDNNNNLAGTDVYAPTSPSTGDLLVDGALNATLGGLTFTNGGFLTGGYCALGGLNNANVALGRAAMNYSQNQSTSQGNVAIGIQAMLLSTNANGNVAVGPDTLSYVQTNLNTAVGAYSMSYITTGTANVGLGSSALYSSTNGSQNTAIGNLALANALTGNNNTALGSGAGYNIIVGNNNIDIGSPGTATDNNTIRVGWVGIHTNIYIAGLTSSILTNTAALVVRPDGLVGINNNLNSLKPFLFAVLTNAIVISNNVEQRIWFNNILSSNNVSYSTNSGLTISSTGIYAINATVTWQITSPNLTGILYLVKNGADYLRVQNNPQQNTSLTFSADIPLNAGDTIDFRVWQNTSSPPVQIAGNTAPVYQTFLSFRQVQ